MKFKIKITIAITVLLLLCASVLRLAWVRDSDNEKERVAKRTIIQKHLVKVAVTSLLSRNPSGLNQQDLLSQVYGESTRVKTTGMLDVEREKFKKKGISQRALIRIITIDSPGDNGNEWTAFITGHLIRISSSDKSYLPEKLPFKMKLKFVKNPDMINNGKMPWIVSNFKFKTYKENPDS